MIEAQPLMLRLKKYQESSVKQKKQLIIQKRDCKKDISLVKGISMQNILSTGITLKRWKIWSKQDCLYCWPTAERTLFLTMMSFLWIVNAHNGGETDRSDTSQTFTEKAFIPDALIFRLKFSTSGSIIMLLHILCKLDTCVPLQDRQALSGQHIQLAPSLMT